MTFVLLLGVSTVLAVAAIAVSLFAVWRTRAVAELSDERTRARLEELQAATDVYKRQSPTQPPYLAT